MAATATGLGGLSPDLIDRILSFSPTFDTLHAAILVSKSWHQVFAARSKSLVLSVATNVVGPALPQAIRLLRYPFPEHEPNSWGEPDSEEDAEGDEISEITAEERTKLQTNASVVNKLEALFSQKHKDPTSTTSRLTHFESHRFTRAMYRIMIYCPLFCLPLNLDDTDSLSEEPEELEKIQRKRYAMLNEFPTKELFELSSVVTFLKEVLLGVLPPEQYTGKILLTASTAAHFTKIWRISASPQDPQRFWSHPMEECLEPEVFSNDGDNALFSGFFSTPLQNIWTDRHEDPPQSKWEPIIDDGSIESPRCTIALFLLVQGYSLNFPQVLNWATFPRHFSPFLKALLPQNAVETEILSTFTSANGSEILIAGLYDVKTSDFDAWKKEDPLCTECLNSFISAHLHLWLLDHKTKGGWVPTDDCWYGWGCRTQVHKRHHALAINHLCAPTR
ncbi:hypothetical protein C8J57DRAFT_1071235 [Mycena rebaudengoi]|nr:hypothetical protein C8J57DRAFT_1071235 [Mycena rebaudengoi]